MLPLVDMHCHLLAGLDDGPQTDEAAEAMCRLAYEDGTRMVAATAHQNERYSEVTPERIRLATAHLASTLQRQGIALTVFPCAEVMAQPDTEVSWQEGRLLTVADRKQYLLLEMPHGIFLDLADTIRYLRAAGVGTILAHPERSEELLHEAGQIERLIEAGALVQVSASSLTNLANRAHARAIKSWVKRGIVHCIGSDGHSPTRRPPLLAKAYQQIVSWAGSAAADRICSTVGMAILSGLPVRVPRPEPRRSGWLLNWW